MAKKRTLPTERTMRWLRGRGWTVAVVEKWNPHAGPHGIRQDLFGFLDLVALHPDNDGVLGVQATSDSGISERIKKILAIPQAKLWLTCGNRILVVGWKQRSIRRATAVDPGRTQWLPREVEVTLTQFNAAELAQQEIAEVEAPF